MTKHESRPVRSVDTGYSRSSLEKWFELDVWQPKEAMCLICDIDPFMADIDWSDKASVGPGDNVEGPRIKNALLLSKDKSFYYLHSELTAEQIERYGPPWEYHDPKKLSKEDKHLAYGRDKDLEFADAQEKLIRLWRIFRRAKDAKEIDSSGTDPQWYVQWALKRGFKIPWLDWAEQHGFLAEDSIAETQADNVVPERITPSDKRCEEGMRAIKTILRRKHADGKLRGDEDYRRWTKKAVVIDHIRKNPADYPLCDKIEPKIDRLLSKDREPTLTKDFPNFTQTKEILDQYERLTGKK